MNKIKSSFLLLLLIGLGCSPISQVQLVESKIPNESKRAPNDFSFSFTTYNIWDLPVLSKKQSERIPAISSALSRRSSEILVLQESWTEEGRKLLLKDAGYDNFITFAFDKGLGTGLMGLSLYPIIDYSYHSFLLNGNILIPDAWSNKGVAHITTPIDDVNVSVFTTHIFAGLPRIKAKKDYFTPTRMMQLFEVFAHVIENSQSDLFVIGGDFNMRFTHDEYAFWNKLTSMKGSLLEERDGTCTYCGFNTNTAADNGQLDYIFISPALDFTDIKVDMTEYFTTEKGKNLNLSDHFGLTAELIKSKTKNIMNSVQARSNFIEALNELKSKLEKRKYIPFKTEDPSDSFQTLGVKDQICQPCQVKKALEKIKVYENAVSESLTDDSFTLQIRGRLKSYFSLFDKN